MRAPLSYKYTAHERLFSQSNKIWNRGDFLMNWEIFVSTTNASVQKTQFFSIFMNWEKVISLDRVKLKNPQKPGKSYVLI